MSSAIYEREFGAIPVVGPLLVVGAGVGWVRVVPDQPAVPLSEPCKLSALPTRNWAAGGQTRSVASPTMKAWGQGCSRPGVSPSIDGAEGDADVVGQDRVWGGSLGGQEKAGSLEVVDEVLGCDEVVLGDVLLVAAAQDGASPAAHLVDLLGEVRIWLELDGAGFSRLWEYVIDGGDEGSADCHVGVHASYGCSSLLRIQQTDGCHGEADRLEQLRDVEGDHVRLPEFDPVCSSRLDGPPFFQPVGEEVEHVDADVCGEHVVSRGCDGHSGAS